MKGCSPRIKHHCIKHYHTYLVLYESSQRSGDDNYRRHSSCGRPFQLVEHQGETSKAQAFTIPSREHNKNITAYIERKRLLLPTGARGERGILHPRAMSTSSRVATTLLTCTCVFVKLPADVSGTVDTYSTDQRKGKRKPRPIRGPPAGKLFVGPGSTLIVPRPHPALPAPGRIAHAATARSSHGHNLSEEKNEVFESTSVFHCIVCSHVFNKKQIFCHLSVCMKPFHTPLLIPALKLTTTFLLSTLILISYLVL